METQLLKFLKVFQWLLRTLSLYRPATRLVRSHLGVWSVKGWDDVLKCTVVFISHGCLSHTQIGRRGTKQKPHICFLFHWCVCVCVWFCGNCLSLCTIAGNCDASVCSINRSVMLQDACSPSSETILLSIHRVDTDGIEPEMREQGLVTIEHVIAG